MLHRVVVAAALVVSAGCTTLDPHQDTPVATPEAAPALYEAPEVEEYRLQAGDSLAIRSYFDAQLNQDALVRTDGRISVLLLGELSVVGVTPQALAEQMRAGYRPLIGATDVTVTVTRSAGMNVFVSGEVKAPALLPLDGQLTVLQALARVGGTLPSAHTGSALLVRNRDDGTLTVSKLDIDRMLLGQAPDVRLRARDVLHLPRSPIAQAGLNIEQYVNAIVPRALQLQLGWISSRVTNRNPVVQVNTP